MAFANLIEQIKNRQPKATLIVLRGFVHSRCGIIEALRAKGMAVKAVIPEDAALSRMPENEVLISMIQNPHDLTEGDVDLLLKQNVASELDCIIKLRGYFERCKVLESIAGRLNREELIGLSHALGRNGGLNAGPHFIFKWMREHNKITDEEAGYFNSSLGGEGEAETTNFDATCLYTFKEDLNTNSNFAFALIPFFSLEPTGLLSLIVMALNFLPTGMPVLGMMKDVGVVAGE